MGNNTNPNSRYYTDENDSHAEVCLYFVDMYLYIYTYIYTLFVIVMNNTTM